MAKWYPCVQREQNILKYLTPKAVFGWKKNVSWIQEMDTEIYSKSYRLPCMANNSNNSHGKIRGMIHFSLLIDWDNGCEIKLAMYGNNSE